MQRMIQRGALLSAGLFTLFAACTSASAADIGGWMQQQDRAQSGVDGLSCAQLATRATQENSALAAYQAALCYLQGQDADALAAKAWLARAAELNHLPAHRMLNAMLRAEAAQHPSAAHCHDLGEGRQLCHGGQGSARQTASP
jgi:TPR repeat protein